MSLTLTKEDWRIARLKAAMYSGGNVEKFVAKAIRAYKEEQNNQPDEVVLFINGQDVTVKNVPHQVRAEGTYENLILSSALEEVLEEEESISDQAVIHFNDLLQ